MRPAFVGWVSRLAHLLATPLKRVRRNPPSAQRDQSPGGLRGALLPCAAARLAFSAANPPYGWLPVARMQSGEYAIKGPGFHPGYVQTHGSRP